MNAPLFHSGRAPVGRQAPPDPDAGRPAQPLTGRIPAPPDGDPDGPGHSNDPTASRPALLLGLIASLVLVLGFGGWSVFAVIDGAIIAPGQVEATRTRLAIQHTDGGRIADLLIRDGQTVAAGALLARLDPGLLAAERVILETQFLEALARQARLLAERDGAGQPNGPLPLASIPGAVTLSEPERAQLGALLDGQWRLLLARQETLSQQLEQLRIRRIQALAQRRGLDAQIAALTREVDLVAAEIVQQSRLVAQGLSPDARLSALRREEVRLQGANAAGAAEQAAIDGRITEIELQVLALQSSRREEAETALRDLGVTLVELSARRNLLDERLARLELRAPQAGRIHGLSLGGPGTVLRPAEPLAELVPEASAPIIALQLRPEDIDRVAPGQPVRILLPATGGRDRPELAGHVTLISADLVEDTRQNQRYFRAEVVLDLPESGAALTAGGNGATELLRLHPGLPVEGHIRTGSRSPLQWFVAPITAQLVRAMRDD